MKSTVEPTTNKQLEILLLLYRFRFLSRTHIQKFLNHKSHTLITTWLKDLTDRNITNRIYSKALVDINKPAIYFLGLKSKPILIEKANIEAAALQRVYRDKNSSQTFRDHSLFLADLYFHFLEVAKQNQAELEFFTATDLLKYAYIPLPRPDTYIVVREENKTKRYFLEVIDDGVPFFAVKSKIIKYLNYYKEEYWQKNYKHPFPKILFIYPSEKVKKWLMRSIPELVDEENLDITFYLGSRERIKQFGITSDTWEAA